MIHGVPEPENGWERQQCGKVEPSPPKPPEQGDTDEDEERDGKADGKCVQSVAVQHVESKKIMLASPLAKHPGENR